MKKKLKRFVTVIDKTAFISPSAVVIGWVTIGRNVMVAPGAVIRADEPGSSIFISDNCNIQDNVIIHALKNSSVNLGRNVSLAHGCVIHGPCQILDDSFIGFNSVVFKAKLGRGVTVKHLALVEGVQIPSGKIVENGSTVDAQKIVKNLKSAGREIKRFTKGVVRTNLLLSRFYRKLHTRDLS